MIKILSHLKLSCAASLQPNLRKSFDSSPSLLSRGSYICCSSTAFDSSSPNLHSACPPVPGPQQSLMSSTASEPRQPYNNPSLVSDLPNVASQVMPAAQMHSVSSQQPLLGLQKRVGPVAVAISGGVDSAVAAMLLKQAG